MLPHFVPSRNQLYHHRVGSPCCGSPVLDYVPYYTTNPPTPLPQISPVPPITPLHSSPQNASPSSDILSIMASGSISTLNSPSPSITPSSSPPVATRDSIKCRLFSDTTSSLPAVPVALMSIQLPPDIHQ